jgi:multicomponent Na+:H+ antiporter subunit G
MTALELASAALIAAGAFFYLAGSVGMLRLPDAYARLHATTKADNLGLGLVILGLVIDADSPFTAAKLILIWLALLASSSVVCHLIARSAVRQGIEPWRKP